MKQGKVRQGRRGRSPTQDRAFRASIRSSVESWTKVTDTLFVHSSGATIERKGFPLREGWYLRAGGTRRAPMRFDPTPAGCDQAWATFAGLQGTRSLRAGRRSSGARAGDARRRRSR